MSWVSLPIVYCNATENKDADFCTIECPKFWADCYMLIYPLWGADEVRGEWWQVVTGIHSEGDGLILLWVMFTRLWPEKFLSCLFCFDQNWHNTSLVTLHPLLQFSLHHIDIFLSVMEGTWISLFKTTCLL